MTQHDELRDMLLSMTTEQARFIADYFDEQAPDFPEFASFVGHPLTDAVRDFSLALPGWIRRTYRLSPTSEQTPPRKYS